VILLDTHILLSALGQIELELPVVIRDQLKSRNEAYVSVATIWEIAIKHRIGKLRLFIELENLPAMIKKQNIKIVPINHDQILADIGPEPKTRDPFDRLLLSVCATEGLELLTIDRALVDHPLAWR
jgi:PIN domain nuclease of toxin-antitoxin system